MERTHTATSPVRRDPVNKPESILLATDRSLFSEGAERESFRFAKRHSSRLNVMSVLETNPEYETVGAAVYEKEEADALRYLESIKARALREGIDHCKAALLFGDDPCRLVIDEAEEKKADLIVLGRRGRSGFLHAFMGRVAANVVSRAPCSVLVVPKAAKIEYRSILVATDGSGHCAAAASEAISLAKHWGSNLIAVCPALSEDEVEKAGVNIRRIVAAAENEGIHAEAITPLGRSHEVIVETASGRGVDLIVIGAPAEKGIKRLFTGSSTTEKVIRHAGCAVLVARTT